MKKGSILLVLCFSAVVVSDHIPKPQNFADANTQNYFSLASQATPSAVPQQPASNDPFQRLTFVGSTPANLHALKDEYVPPSNLNSAWGAASDQPTGVFSSQPNSPSSGSLFLSTMSPASSSSTGVFASPAQPTGVFTVPSEPTGVFAADNTAATTDGSINNNALSSTTSFPIGSDTLSDYSSVGAVVYGAEGGFVHSTANAFSSGDSHIHSNQYQSVNVLTFQTPNELATTTSNTFGSFQELGNHLLGSSSEHEPQQHQTQQHQHQHQHFPQNQQHYQQQQQQQNQHQQQQHQHQHVASSFSQTSNPKDPAIRYPGQSSLNQLQQQTVFHTHTTPTLAPPTPTVTSPTPAVVLTATNPFSAQSQLVSGTTTSLPDPTSSNVATTALLSFPYSPSPLFPYTTTAPSSSGATDPILSSIVVPTTTNPLPSFPYSSIPYTTTASSSSAATDPTPSSNVVLTTTSPLPAFPYSSSLSPYTSTVPSSVPAAVLPISALLPNPSSLPYTTTPSMLLPYSPILQPILVPPTAAERANQTEEGAATPLPHSPLPYAPLPYSTLPFSTSSSPYSTSTASTQPAILPYSSSVYNSAYSRYEVVPRGTTDSSQDALDSTAPSSSLPYTLLPFSYAPYSASTEGEATAVQPNRL
mmetsp:Transcript_24200/g.47566  ORF Transcript_24200/g.47566 Transcript_24200/m.47566 type:complete len:643 (-) Transcript_24200:331-2259(-)